MPTQTPQRSVENHLAWAIVSLILFWPLAIPAIVNASKVNGLLAAGNHSGAQQAARAARMWARRATIFGIIWWVLSAACIPLAVVAAVDPTHTAGWISHLLGHS